MNRYEYTACWFTVADMDKYLLSNINISEKTDILEIGSYEGRSSIWFLENIIKHHKDSRLTCVDPWLDYSQNNNTFSSYDNECSEWKIKQNKIYDRFLYNINQSGYSNQTIIKQGKSYDVLKTLTKESYDVIFIDGNHTAPCVISDAIMSWFLLKMNGIIIFDDYGWVNHKAIVNNERNLKLEPKIAIDYFIDIFEGYVEVIYNGYRKAVKKIK